MTIPAETLKEIDEINGYFQARQGRAVQVWRYDVAHSVLELVMMHAGQVRWKGSTAEHTTIYCHMTHTMNLPEMSWRSSLVAAESVDDGGNKLVVIEDRSNGTRILCDRLILTVGRHPNAP